MRRFLSVYKFKLAIFFFGMLVFSFFWVDPDFGWHLALGNHFLSGLGIVRGDIFSWTMPGYVWGNSYFLYQIVIALIFNKFGYAILVLIFGTIASLALVILCRDLNLWKTFFVLLAALISRANLAVRPHTISFFFFAVLLILIEREFFKKKYQPIFYFTFFALWANLHRGFVVGLIVFALYILVDYFYERSFGRIKSVFMPICCLIGGLAGSFLTPFSLQLWNSGVVHDFTSFDNLNYIQEWQPSGLFFPSNIFFAMSGILLVFMFLGNSKKIAPQWFLISAVLFMLAFLSANFLFFWTVICVFMICRYFNFKIEIKYAFLGRILPCLVLLFFIISTYIYSPKPGDAINLNYLFKKGGYPVDAVAYMREHGLVKNVFNEFAWGGFVDWQAPEIKVFIDGRMASWRMVNGRSLLGDYVAITQGECKSLKNYDIRVVLISKKTRLSCFGDFNQVWHDKNSAVLVKRE